MAKIKKIIAREILDSRALPTIESIIELDDGAVNSFSVPSGASVGKHESVELRDQDPKRFDGLGVLNCLRIISQTLSPQLIGQDAYNQEEIDNILIKSDGTGNKSKLGANTTLALSGAVVKAASISQKIPLYQYVSKLYGTNSTEFSLPTPMFNILNGGLHAGGNLDFQEFMVVPSNSNSYSQGLKLGVETYYGLKKTLLGHSMSTLVGDEGGYAPTLYTNMDAFKILEEATQKALYKVNLDAFFSIDAAANNLKRGSSYKIRDKPMEITSSELMDYYFSINEQYRLLSIEDPFGEDDWADWTQITQKLGNETLIVGDDLTTTNIERLKKAISEKACNSIIIKPNQSGTISETLKVVKGARDAGFKIIVSHRSGETNDDFIADFAVGVGANYVKFGAPARGERVAKYNRLLEIEHELS